MKSCFLNGLLGLSLFVFILAGQPQGIFGSERASKNPGSKDLIGQIVSIKTEDKSLNGRGHETRVRIEGNGKIAEYRTQALRSPTRLIIDIFSSGESYETAYIPLKSAGVSGVRVGYHQDKIRVVLDIKGEEAPAFSTRITGHRLTIVLGPGKGKQFKVNPRQADSRKPNPEADAIRNGVKGNKAKGRFAPGTTPPAHSKTARNLVSDSPGVRAFPGPVEGKPSGILRERADIEERLMQGVADDGKNDTAHFITGLNAYRDREWKWAEESFKGLIKKFPEGRYTERAYFLLAKSLEKLYAESLSENLVKVKNRYEDAVNRFPDSQFQSDAYLSIGNLYMSTGSYYEALGYYNLILKKEEFSQPAMGAVIQKAKILLEKERKADALVILEDAVEKYPDTVEKLEAKKEIAKILYRMNSYQRSLDLLTQISQQDPLNIYRLPEIVLYMGYNHYQLGDSSSSRKYFLRFYNINPRSESNHLVIAQVGDTCRDEGNIRDAIKFYQLAIERYPETEGALISYIRLAEIQEKSGPEIGAIIAASTKKIGTPKEIYEEIMRLPRLKGKENPLTQVALVKLAVLHQKEKAYDKSLDALKELIRKFPKNALKRESRHVLTNTIEAILKEEMRRHRYPEILEFYQKDEPLFSMIKSPEAFLAVARACLKMDQEDAAVPLFQKAEPLMPQGEKPPELLFYLSQDRFKKGDSKGALEGLKRLVEQYPKDRRTGESYLLRGDILLNQKNYRDAAEMYSAALKYQRSNCEKSKVLFARARAFSHGKFKERAFSSLEEMEKMREKCRSTGPGFDDEVGDLYMALGSTEKALNKYQQATEKESDEAGKVSTRLKVARCYWLLKKEKESLAIYDQIAGLNDPFWSSLAKEKLDEIQFNREMRER